MYLQFRGSLGETMTEYNVSATFKIYVEDSQKMDTIKSSIERLVKVQKFWEEDVGFGIKVLKASTLMNDSEGGMDKLEEAMKNVDGISQVEVEEVSRI